MEIISYLKGKKTQKEVEKLHEVIGQDEFKSGTKDVIDTWDDADERIQDLEKKVKDKILSVRVSELTKRTAINLNKQNLLANSVFNARKNNMTDLEFVNFNQESDIIKESSSNISVNTSLGKLIVSNKNSNGKALINHSIKGNVSVCILESISSGRNTSGVNLAQTTHDLNSIELVSGLYKLQKEDSENFYDFGEIIIDLSSIGEAYIWNEFIKQNEVLNNGLIETEVYNKATGKIIVIGTNTSLLNKDLQLVLRMKPGKTDERTSVLPINTIGLSTLDSNNPLEIKSSAIQILNLEKKDFAKNEDMSNDEFTFFELEVNIGDLNNFTFGEVYM